MAGSGVLDPPAEVRTADSGAHQLVEHSDSEDQFMDAQSAPMSPNEGSPAPKTRVEKVNHEPAYGEAPGTQAHRMRESDSKPDEIAVNSDHGSESIPSSQSETVPTTIVQEAPGPVGSPSPEFENKRQTDASPGVVLDSNEDDKDTISRDGDDTPKASSLAAPGSTGRPRRKSSRAARSPAAQDDEFGDEDGGDDDAFGDDFDDFEEGGEDDDFDDFDGGFQQPEHSAQALSSTQQTILPFAIPDFDGLSADDVMAATEPYLATLFPPEELDVPQYPPLPKDPTPFTTPRSASLWSQLVAPPPLAPPDWIRSRTRRLFLVSLGVPVDLDEILPASKQKKLVLPSLNVPSSTSPRTSSDCRSVSRLRQGEGNTSSTSVDTQGKPKRRKGPPPPPEFDMVAARHMCMTTDEALDGMTNEELKAHAKKLGVLEGTAKEVLEYWKKRTDEKIAERETFEGVIENFVKHAQKVRK